MSFNIYNLYVNVSWQKPISDLAFSYPSMKSVSTDYHADK